MQRYVLRTRWPFIIFALAVLLAAQILVTLNYFYQNTAQDMENTVADVEKNLILQHTFMQNLQNAFLAQRSFSITGNTQFKTRYQELSARLTPQLQTILDNTHLIEKDSAQILRSELRDMIDFMASGIRRRETEGGSLVPSAARAKDAFMHMSRLDSRIDQLIKRERAHLTEVKLEQRAQQQTYNQSILLVALLSSLCLGGLGYLLLKQQQKENRTESDLKSVKERLDLAIHGANDGIWDWDLLNNHIYYSPRLKEIAGYRDAEMPNALEAYDLLIHPDDRAPSAAALQNYLQQQAGTYECTFRIRHKDGSWRWIMSRGQALWNQDNRPYRMVGVHTDVTSMKTLEEGLHKARETAEEADRAKSDFLSNISHEIRTPLNAIIGISRILAKAQTLNESFREHVNVMHTGAKNLFSLISDLLDLSKLEQGSLVLELREFRLRDLIQENVELYRYYARDKAITLTFDSNLPLDALYKGDSLRISQIVNNLLSNAMKFTEAGTVHVSLMRGETPAGNNNQTIILTVEDTGIGIPASQIDNIFNKFAQSDKSISRRYGGTGLGLSICKELCQIMGATIAVHSLEGQGSEFTVTFVLEAANDAAAGLQPSPDAPDIAGFPAPMDEQRILLVEDYEPNVFVIEALLQSLGYACDSVMTGEEALRVLLSDRRQSYAAVLMDLELPDMTGYAVAEKNRQYEGHHGLPSLPIIATTAHASPTHRERCYASGMNDYLMKPVDLSALEKTLSLYVPPHTLSSQAAATRTTTTMAAA